MLELWIITMTVLTVIHAELTESSSNRCYDKDKIGHIIRVDQNETAFVSCPAIAENETLKSVSLHKGDRELHKTPMENYTLQAQDRYHLSIRNFSLSYKILRSEANDTGLYTCTVHTASKTQRRESKTILLVKEPVHPTEPPPTCPVKQTLPLAVGCGIIITYNLFITIGGGFLAYKLKHIEPPENPYMNTRGAFRR